jgi:hypothetical protein
MQNQYLANNLLTMRIRINRTDLELFGGATVADALRRYYVLHKKKFPEIFPAVTDRHGNYVAPDGSLSEGNQLYLKTKK